MMSEDWVIVPRSMLNLLFELLRKRRGLEEDEELQNLLEEISLLQLDNKLRKDVGREILAKKKEDVG